jgi:RimJ/RimL family protein N-acetyltransferase
MNPEEIEVTLREAIPTDAAQLLEFWRQEVLPCDFLVTDDFDAAISPHILAEEIATIYESDNNLLLLAFADQDLVSYLRIAAEQSYQRGHVGELGIIVSEKFRHQGLGQALMTAGLDWVVEESQLKRVELYVQKRNKVAQKLYEHFDFKTEGELPDSFRRKDGQLISTLLMARLF